MLDSSAIYQLSLVLKLSRELAAELHEGCSNRYRVVAIPKQNGKWRRLEIPDKPLKKAQKQILRWLYTRVSVGAAVTGGVPGGSVVKHASPHIGQEIVITMDLKDFFPSVNYGQVRFALERNSIAPNFARAITRLCTRRKKLPQGAPTSPLLGNLVLHGLDRRLRKLAASHGAYYTRYIDDMAFSGKARITRMVPAVRRLVSQAGFTLATKKTRVMDRNGEQVITGLVVNDKLALSAEHRQEIMFLLNAYRNHWREPSNIDESRQHLRDVLLGHAAYLGRIDAELAGEIQAAARSESRRGSSPVTASR